MTDGLGRRKPIPSHSRLGTESTETPPHTRIVVPFTQPPAGFRPQRWRSTWWGDGSHTQGAVWGSVVSVFSVAQKPSCSSINAQHSAARREAMAVGWADHPRDFGPPRSLQCESALGGERLCSELGSLRMADTAVEGVILRASGHGVQRTRLTGQEWANSMKHLRSSGILSIDSQAV